jgi:hypothetical protein
MKVAEAVVYAALHKAAEQVHDVVLDVFHIMLRFADCLYSGGVGCAHGDASSDCNGLNR